ncbi:MAG: hypothetical protein Q7K65_00175 [Candidatus Buchananbacteria bacterium]|nr:hypothetical protein [Candidatus Buchananbacteria bacterium]
MSLKLASHCLSLTSLALIVLTLAFISPQPVLASHCPASQGDLVCEGADVVCGGICRPAAGLPTPHESLDCSTCTITGGSIYTPVYLNYPSSQPGSISVGGNALFGGNVGITGNVSTTKDIYVNNGKAIRVDGTGSTNFNLGNWAVGATGFGLNVYGNLQVSKQLMFGGLAETLGAGQNLLYGNISASASAGSLLLLQKGGTNRFIVDTGGNATSSGHFSASELCIGNNCKSSWPVSSGAGYFTQTGSSLYPNDLSWNVGIGTASPEQRLTISGVNATLGLYNTFNDSGNRNWAIGTSMSQYGDFSLRQSNAKDGDPMSNGVVRFYISQNGKIGIGTASPQVKLEINDDTTGIAQARISDYTQNPELQLQYGGNDNDHWGIYVDQNGKSLNFWSLGGGDGAGNQMTIYQNGVVAIYSPTLNISPNTNNSSAGGGVIQLLGAYTSADKFSSGIFSNSNWDRVTGNWYYEYDGPSGRISFSADSDGNPSGDWLISTAPSGAANDINNVTLDSNVRMIIKNGGNVGIGTMSPAEKLEVNGAVKLGNTTNNNPGTIRYTGSGFEGRTATGWVSLAGGAAGGIGGSGTLNYVPKFTAADTLGNSVIFSNALGQVGIGTTNPSTNRRLDVAGDVFLSSAGSLYTNSIYSTGNGADTIWVGDGNDKLRIEGPIQINYGSPSNNKVLTAIDNTGNAEWRTVSGGADNLGNHTMTQVLSTNGQQIINYLSTGETDVVVNDSMDVRGNLHNDGTDYGGKLSIVDGAYIQGQLSIGQPGTTNTKLHVLDVNGPQLTLQGGSVPGNGKSGLRLQTDDTATWEIYSAWNDYKNFYIEQASAYGGEKILTITQVGSVGINSTSPGAKLQIDGSDQFPNGERLRLISASGWSPFNIRNSANNADIFRVDQSGTLAVGSVPVARIANSNCSTGQYVTGFNGGLVCGTPTSGSTYSAGSGLTLTGTQFSAQAGSALWNSNELQGRSIAVTAPASGQVLKWNGSSWAPAADTGGTSYSAGSGLTLSGTQFSAQAGSAIWNANKLLGRNVSDGWSGGPTAGQVLTYDSLLGWVPSTPSSGNTYTAGSGLTLSGTQFSAQIGSAVWNANQLQGRVISATTPSSNQVLTWNGSAWAPANAAATSDNLGNHNMTMRLETNGNSIISSIWPGFGESDVLVDDWMDVRYGIHNDGTANSGRLFINDNTGISGDLFLDGNSTSNGSITMSGNITADSNSRGNCTWTGWSQLGAVCPGVQYMAGVDIREVGAGGTQEQRIYCCNL